MRVKVWRNNPAKPNCPRCQSLEGTAVRLTESFHDHLRGALDGPPLHPNCDCFLEFVDEPDVEYA